MELHDAYIVLDGVEMNIPLRSMTNDNLDKSNRFIIPGEEHQVRDDTPYMRTAFDTYRILHQVDGMILRALITLSIGHQ
jgi:hypothetical protein